MTSKNSFFFLRIRLIFSALAISMAAGCATGEINVIVDGMPDAPQKLKSKTIEVHANPSSDLMTKRASESVKSVLINQGMKWVPKDGQIIMEVTMTHEGQNVGNSNSHYALMDIYGITLTARENGEEIWHGRITGSSEWVVGELQAGCVRELIQQKIADYGSHDEGCWKSAYR